MLVLDLLLEMFFQTKQRSHITRTHAGSVQRSVRIRTVVYGMYRTVRRTKIWDTTLPPYVIQYVASGRIFRGLMNYLVARIMIAAATATNTSRAAVHTMSQKRSGGEDEEITPSELQLEAAILVELSECVHLLPRLQLVLSDMVQLMEEEPRSSRSNTTTTTTTTGEDPPNTHNHSPQDTSLSRRMNDLLRELQEWEPQQQDTTG